MTGAGIYVRICIMVLHDLHHINRKSCIDQEDEIPVPDTASSCFTTKNINIMFKKSFNAKLRATSEIQPPQRILMLRIARRNKKDYPFVSV